MLLTVTGVSGSAGAAAAQHAGPGHRSGGGGATVPVLDQGGGTVPAGEPCLKTATISIVEVGECVILKILLLKSSVLLVLIEVYV